MSRLTTLPILRFSRQHTAAHREGRWGSGLENKVEVEKCPLCGELESMDHQAARCRVIAATFGTADKICREAGGRGIAPGEETALGPSGEGRELDRIVHAKARQAVDDTRRGEFVERKEKAEKEGGGFTAGAVPLYSERLTARRMVNHFLKLMRALS